jgi:uncharacterized protein YhhL (DUF1145 family)
MSGAKNDRAAGDAGGDNASPSPPSSKRNPRRSDINVLSIENIKRSAVLFPALIGVTFIAVLLGLTLAFPAPTNFQIWIFKAVLALAGGAFATMLTGILEVEIPLLRGGRVRAAAGFGVFALIFLVFPDSLFSDERKVRADEFGVRWDNSFSVLDARLDDIWKTSEGKIRLQAFSTRAPKELNATRQYLNERLTNPQYRLDYDKVKQFLVDVVNCVDGGRCDTGVVCDKFFMTAQELRTTYCETMLLEEREEGDKTGRILRNFTVNHCRDKFISTYLKRFDEEEPGDMCYPAACWALKTHEAGCAATVSGGIALPAAL